MRAAPKYCECCGAKMVEYVHVLSKGLVRCLAKLAVAGGGPLSIADDLKLSKSEYTNFGKLQYWQLVEHADPQVERGGIWKLTTAGWAFVSGELALQPRVWTYRGRVVRFENAAITIDQVTGGWKYRPEYAREARAHFENQGAQP